MSKSPPVYVTRPYLPPLDQFTPYLEQIWERGILTNSGPCALELEDRLRDFLGVEHVSLTNNGTVALIIALQFLPKQGEVITTPYSFVATANALLWTGFKPVFVDIDPDTCNLDPAKIEAAITPDTVAILPVHCYGIPCDVNAIEEIARRHDLRVIYDAAHAFWIERGGESILRKGDLSTLSFHATKVFNTFEGGAIISPDAESKKRIDQLRNFGFVDEVTVVTAGMNGKMAEVNAAFGLLQLDHVEEAIAGRRAVDARYRELLRDTPGIGCVALPEDATSNHGYFPILVESSYPLSRDALYDRLKEHGIFARRYFYPLITSFPMYRDLPSANPQNLPQAHALAERVLCLPIYPDLPIETVERIVEIVGAA